MNNNICYFYHRADGYNVTIAYSALEEPFRGPPAGKYRIAFGAAFCNSSDQFSKSMGRAIAEGRMNTPPDRDSGAPSDVPVSIDDPRWRIHEKILKTLPFVSYAPENFFWECDELV